MSVKNPIVVLGASGQVGRALSLLLGDQGVALSRAEADLSRVGELLDRLERLHHPSVVINAAAYTQVDRAEEEADLAMQINGVAPGELAKWCAGRGIPFVHYSTDYVFPGTGARPWSEEDATDPLNSYGRSKLEGERRVAEAGGRWLIFRTSWVYDETGKNFLNTMLRLGREKEVLKVVSDQIGAPTYASHLAQATLKVLENALERCAESAAFDSGVYHLCGGGETSWHGFAQEIFRQARDHGIQLAVKSVEGIPASLYPTPARRPSNSRLNQEKVARTFGVVMPDWKVGLRECFANLTSQT